MRCTSILVLTYDEIIIMQLMLKQTGILGTFVGKFKTGVTYTVTESDISVPYGYAAVKPFTFTINENTGAVTVSTGAPASVSKAEIRDTINTLVTIKEPLVTLTVDKKDQNRSLVDGATSHWGCN